MINLTYSQLVNIVRDSSDIVIPKEIRGFGLKGGMEPPVKKILLKHSKGRYWYRLYFNYLEDEIPEPVNSAFIGNRRSDILDTPHFSSPGEAYSFLQSRFLFTPRGGLNYIDFRP